MQRIVKVAFVVAASAAWLFSMACLAPPIESPATHVYQDTPIRVSQNAHNKVDLLFMVDNSQSMDAMQLELRARFKDFFQVFTDLATQGQYADLHIGVVTSDYGAGNTVETPCDKSPGGQKGLLQALGAAAPMGCQPPQGKPYIEFTFTAAGGTSNLPAGQDLVGTFTCMASVGSGGCGFEHQLESVYAALHNTNENAGFLRDDALLTIVFVTNEDDSSSPPTTDIFDPLQLQYGYYDTYRQTRFGVACGSPLMLTPYAASMGPLPNCRPAENDNMVMLGKEYDISRYTDYFLTPGLKMDPVNDLILVGIEAPDDKVETILALNGSGSGQGQFPRYEPCDPLDPPHCIVRLNHTCQNNVKPEFFGDPPVRINTLLRKAHFNQLGSICGADENQPPDYTSALKQLGDLIVSQLKPGCVPAPIASLTNPDCTVEDVTMKAGAPTLETPIPRCDRVANALPCWEVKANDKCAGISPQGVGVVINRAVAPPMGTVARVECATIAK